MMKKEKRKRSRHIALNDHGDCCGDSDYSLFGLYQILSLNEDVKQISRKYMLTMETMGYLDAASRTSLMQDLSDLQVTDIDLTGSTMTDAGYGNAVYLQITCKLPIEQLNMDGNDMLRFFFEDGTIPIRVRRMSTAKN